MEAEKAKLSLPEEVRKRFSKEGYFYPGAVEDKTLTDLQKVVLSIMYVLTEKGQRAIYPCYSKIAKDWGINVNSFTTAVRTLIDKALLAKDEHGRIYLPELYEGYKSLFWEVKVSYSLLGVFYFFLWYFRRRIKSGELCNGGLFVKVMTETFGLKNIYVGRSKFYRATEFFERNGYLSKYYSSPMISPCSFSIAMLTMSKRSNLLPLLR